MSPTNPASAVAAYSNTVRAGVPVAEPTIKAQPLQTFSTMVEGAAEQALAAGKMSEKMTAKAVAGQADLSDVVTAVANAELTLQTVVSVRDKVVSAYQEILRMPI